MRPGAIRRALFGRSGFGRLVPMRSGAHAPRRTLPALLLIGLLSAVGSGCGPRYERTPVIELPLFTVELRAQRARGGEPVDRGFNHPMVVSSVRLANILARIDLREAGKQAKRRPAIPNEMLFDVAGGLSKALSKANPSQEVVLKAIERSRRLGLFTRKHLTSLVAYQLGETLYIYVGHSQHQLENKGPNPERVPDPYVGTLQQRFKLLPTDGISAVDDQTVAIAWRDPRFRENSAVQLRPSGQVVRRQVLLESPQAEVSEEAQTVLESLDELTPAELRALADLEERRRAGEIPESEYSVRRNRILRGEGIEP